MGLLKTTNETHYHLSKEAAKEQRKAAEAEVEAAWNASSGERAMAHAKEEAARQQRKAEEKVAKEQRKAEENVAKQHRKEVEAQIKHEKEMKLLQEDPEAYKAYLEREHQQKMDKRKWIVIGIIAYVVIAIVVSIIV